MSLTVSNDILARIFLRFTLEQELSEQEMQIVLSNNQLRHLHQYSEVEPLFLTQYVDVMRTRTATQITNFLKSNARWKEHGAEILDKLWETWSQLVMTPTLNQMQLLSEDGIQYLSTAFAAIVREFVGSPILIEFGLTVENCSIQRLRKLAQMGLEDECNTVLATKLPAMIKNYVASTWDQLYLETSASKIRDWINNVLVLELRELIPTSELPKETLYQLAIRELAHLRINEIFKLVQSGNTSSFKELEQAIRLSSSLRGLIVTEFVTQCSKSVLNGASDTVEIIKLYLQTITAFSIIDPQGVLLERVSAPIRQELKARSDTCVKLAEGIFGDSTSPLNFLNEDLWAFKKAKALKMDSSDKYTIDFSSWIPDPVDTPVDFVRRQTQDRVSTLINLYDNKEIFVQQFAQLFSAELLRMSFDDLKTLQRLEDLLDALDQKFGETDLLKIKVMLEDVKHSHKIAEIIHRELGSGTDQVSALILSRLYWPSLPQAPQPILPAVFQQLIDQYTEKFKQIPEFSNLHLRWLRNQGRVNITLIMEERELTMTVKYHEAVLISAFESKPLSLAELKLVTHLDEPLLLDAIQFWIDQKVLGVDGENYKTLETLADVEKHKTQASTQIVAPTESTGQYKAVLKDPFEDMHAYWSYIVGMLTNLGGLPLEKIQSFLVMFVPSESPYVKTKQELENYLLAMVDEEKLKLEAEKYSLVNRR